MAFGQQQIFPIDLNNSAAVGISLPFNGPAVFKSNYQTKDSIKYNLINFFLTNPGERLLNPTFGGGIRNFIFEQIYNDNIEFLLEDISLKVRNYFPNIQIEDLNVSRNENNNEISINFTYKVINTNIQDEINISFT
jgi:phage baseplate assembly protein W